MGHLINDVPFAELVAKTNFSFLEGASFPEEMIQEAHRLGYAALGLTDRSGVYGIPRAHAEAEKLGFPLIVGAELKLPLSQNLMLLAKNKNGYGNLCELLTAVHARGRETVQATWEDVFEKQEDLFLLVPAVVSETVVAENYLAKAKACFGDRLYLVASRFYDGEHSRSPDMALHLSKKLGISCIASNQPLFHSPKRKPIQDVLTCIHHSCTLRDGGFKLLPNEERYLKPIKTIRDLFHSQPGWLENTVKIASECKFSMSEIRYNYPNEWLPKGETSDSYLRKLVYQSLPNRYPKGTPPPVVNQIEHELRLIEQLQYADYFLTIWDIVQFAKEKEILFQGRGSAANSCVCFVLGITAIDPVRMNLLFERFISQERKEPPDIDIDFEHERREEVIQYLYSRYGRHRAAIAAEVICYRRKSALRETAKVFEIPEPVVLKLLSSTHREDIQTFSKEKVAECAVGFEGITERKINQFWTVARTIQGFPRHIGTHVGGFVLCQENLSRNVPIEKAAMPDRTIIQWDKNDLDALGFIKVDILGLGILTCIRKSFTCLEQTYGKKLTLATVPAEDPKVYQAMSRADTVGVFQIESRAQMNMLPRLKPRTFYDLVVEISLVRPGPIQGDMVHPYLKRRNGEEPIEYAHPDLKAILQKTYGVPLFQEQIMKMAMVVAGFSAGEADQLRRAMGTWRKNGGLSQLGDRFKAGLIRKGITKEFADRIFRQIEGFAEYGFPESHAASFAILAYVTAYLKYYHQDVFLTALLNSQPMGFYSNHSLIYDGIRHGVSMLPIDINHSDWDNKIEKPGFIRMGFREIRGMATRIGEAIEKNRPYTSLSDLLSKVPNLNKRDLFLIAGAQGFKSLGYERRQAFWEIQGLSLQDGDVFSPTDGQTELPHEKKWESISNDYDAQGVSIVQHPIAWLRESFHLKGITPSHEIKKKKERSTVLVAGIVICRQMPPTASGVLFLTLEDEFGFYNLVVWNDVYQKHRHNLITQSFLMCEGKIQKAKDGEVTHVVVDNAYPLLTPPSPPKQLISHDFH